MWIGVVVGTALATRGDIELLDGRLWLRAQERLRLEYRARNVTFNDDIGADTDAWLLHRLRLGLGVRPVEWVRAYGELQDAREADSRRFPFNGNLEEGEFDWRLGWVELANYKQFPLGLKVGRQELSYGDERLLGAFDWNNVGRVFDAVKVRWQQQKLAVDFFAARVVLNNLLSGRDDPFDDRSDGADRLFGLYLESAVCPLYRFESYALFRNKSNGVFDGPARDIWTLGARLQSSPKAAPWDSYAEIAGQFGRVDAPGSAGTGTFPARRFGDNSLADNVSHRALAAVIGGGYTFSACPLSPRLGLEYNFASGDDDPADGKNTTFDNLFPTNHKFFGSMDLVAWKNVHNPRVQLSFQPHARIVVQLEYHLFWLATNRDFWYRANGAPVGTPARRDASGGASSFVGSELDLTVTWTPCRFFKLQGGYSHFFAGGFVRDTVAGGNGRDDADFAYIQTSIHF